jgi:hypothetical protein
MAIKLHKVTRKLELDLDGEIIAVEVYKLDIPLSVKLGEKQRLVSDLSKEFTELQKSDLSDEDKGLKAQELLVKIYQVYIDMFKICVVDYSVIEKTINDIPYTATDKFVEILNELNHEMTKTEMRQAEKKN